MTEQQQAMQTLRQHQFSAIDTAMFLDSHPDDEAALQYFRSMVRQAKQAEDAYLKHFGPLKLSDAGQGKRWNWADEPWPWEGQV